MEWHSAVHFSWTRPTGARPAWQASTETVLPSSAVDLQLPFDVRKLCEEVAQRAAPSVGAQPARAGGADGTQGGARAGPGQQSCNICVC